MRKLTRSALAKAILGGIAVLLAHACSPPQSAGSAQEVTLRLKWLHQAQFAGFYAAAQDSGAYAQENIQVRIEPGGPDFPAIQTVVSGGEEFGVAGADQILLARSQGVPVVPLAVIYRENPFVLFARADSRIHGPADFHGRRVGVKLGGNEELIYRAMVRGAHVDFGRITEVPVQFDMAPFFARSVDVWPGYAINEPLVAQEQNVPVTIIRPSEYGVNLYADTLFTTERLIRDNPDLVHRFLRASIEGWSAVVQHPDQGGSLAMLYAPESSLEHQTAMMRASIPYINPDGLGIGAMSRAGWEQTRQILASGGFLTSPVDLDAMLALSTQGGATVR